MIPRYRDGEPNLEVRRAARNWAKAGWIIADQLNAVLQRYPVDLSTGGSILRLLSAGFTMLAAAALVGLIAVVIEPGATGLAFLLVALALPLAAVADRTLIGDRGWYRRGVEEALLATALGFLLAAAVLLGYELDRSQVGNVALVCHALGVAGCALLTYRYGYAWAALLCLLSSANLPAHLLWRTGVRVGGLDRMLAAALAAAVALACARLLRHRGAELPLGHRNCLRWLRGGGVALAYLTTNYWLNDLGRLRSLAVGVWGELGSPRWWLSVCLGATALLPPALLFLGVRRRDRDLLWLGAVTAVLSVVTLKVYFHLGFLAWELTAGGAVLIATAWWLLRWLHAGPDRQRAGFTAEPLLPQELVDEDLAALAAAIPFAPIKPSAEEGFRGGGGSFGGGGAGDSF